MKKPLLTLSLLLFCIWIFAQNVGIGTDSPQGELHVTKLAPALSINFTGTGLDDLSVDASGYTGTGSQVFYIRVENSGPTPNIFQWGNDGINWSANIPMSTNSIVLIDGISISFASTSGHTYNDQWVFSVSPDFPDGLIVKNGKVGIGTTDPVSKLDIKGKLNLGNDANQAVDGDIRYNNENGDFEGYDSNRWYSLTDRLDTYYVADTTNLNSYNMDIDYSTNSIIATDSVGIIYDEGGENGPTMSGYSGIYISNNANTPAVKIRFKIENYEAPLNLYYAGNSMNLVANETKTFEFLINNNNLSELLIKDIEVVNYSGYKITYTFLYLDSASVELPQGAFPLTYSIYQNAMIGGRYTYLITEDSIGANSFQYGNNAKAKGAYSIAMGIGTNASGYSSTSIGTVTSASKIYSTAMGHSTIASGDYSTAMGRATEASGHSSTAMGAITTASGSNSTAMGVRTTASGDYSTAMGFYTIASASNSLAIGLYNTGSIFHSFSIGNGTTNSLRSNSFYIHTNGNGWIQGTLSQNSDKRLKTQITSVNSSLVKLSQLNGYNYYWKDRNRDRTLQTGLIAQELQAIFPELVQEEDNGFLSVNYIGLIPHLLEAIKELKVENDQLKAKNETLEITMNDLIKRVEALEKE